MTTITSSESKRLIARLALIIIINYATNTTYFSIPENIPLLNKAVGLRKFCKGIVRKEGIIWKTLSERAKQCANFN